MRKLSVELDKQTGDIFDNVHKDSAVSDWPLNVLIVAAAVFGIAVIKNKRRDEVEHKVEEFRGGDDPD